MLVLVKRVTFLGGEELKKCPGKIFILTWAYLLFFMMLSKNLPPMDRQVGTTVKSVEYWGPFLERPGNLPGPESDFEIQVSSNWVSGKPDPI